MAGYTDHFNPQRIELPKLYGAQPNGEPDQRSGEQRKC